MVAPRAQPDDLFLRLLEPGSLLSKIVIARLNRFTRHNPPTHFGVEKGWRWLFNPVGDARGRGLLKYYRYWRAFKVNDRFCTEVALQFGRPDVHTIMFNGRDAAADERAQLSESMRTGRSYYEASPTFHAAVGRLKGIGISSEFGTYQEDRGAYNALGLQGTVAGLERLEALAAEDAGYRSPDEREAAARRFRIFLLRNCLCNSKDYRERHADVGGSPYDDPGNWPKET
ncbi:hypothetical protein SSBR45G_70460 [Bradyrhizobium sp. SSBR45G]|uniref:hypothetical protein n=1 Tax=unclassified Bradyrhizobium TaxID=2631580 RepID=UPI002342B016|nr:MULTISPECIES: hypothetical protein [unclassified Bradyrhizobium]GLH82137.1 hypothetical protein SSBR45G_70460 [Bradyrhizobium sp. SSBR45G]GLH89576.1 hypothetical protein SSBR45R_70370 [Bradyrhizobium sp. SSBR45R]